MSNNSDNGIFNMIHDEKNGKMDPEKWAAIHDPRASAPNVQRSNGHTSTDDDSRMLVSGLPVRRVEPRMSSPGAYRVGDTESDYGGQSIAGDSDASESCLYVLPKASLVDGTQKDGVMKDDVEAPSSKIPIVRAQRSPDALHSAPTQKKRSHKRKFRCCMILCCLLLAGLLGAVLYMLKEDENSFGSALEAADGGNGGNGNSNDFGNGNDFDFDNDGRGGGNGSGGGGGDGGRGNGGNGGGGRGNSND